MKQELSNEKNTLVNKIMDETESKLASLREELTSCHLESTAKIKEEFESEMEKVKQLSEIFNPMVIIEPRH